MILLASTPAETRNQITTWLREQATAASVAVRIAKRQKVRSDFTVKRDALDYGQPTETAQQILDKEIPNENQR